MAYYFVVTGRIGGETVSSDNQKYLPKFEYCPFCGDKGNFVMLLVADYSSDGIKRFIYNVEDLGGCGKSFDIWVAEV